MTSSNKKENLTLNRVIHEPVRLQIISYLAAGDRQVPFSELIENLGLTAGNLSVQLKKLEEAGYVSITKSFKQNRPLTRASLTRLGMKALQQYLQELEMMIDRLKENMAHEESEQDEPKLILNKE